MEQQTAIVEGSGSEPAQRPAGALASPWFQLARAVLLIAWACAGTANPARRPQNRAHNRAQQSAPAARRGWLAGMIAGLAQAMRGSGTAGPGT